MIACGELPARDSDESPSLSVGLAAAQRVVHESTRVIRSDSFHD